jgi:hypothetical protein
MRKATRNLRTCPGSEMTFELGPSNHLTTVSNINPLLMTRVGCGIHLSKTPYSAVNGTVEHN